MITPHYSANSDGHAPHVHLNFKGMGLAVVNALCSELIIISRDGTYEWTQTYRSGKPQSPPVKRECSGASGTQLQLSINAGILAPPSPAAIAQQLSDCTHLFPRFDVSLNGKKFYSERGLAALAQSLAPDTSSPVIHKSKRCEAFRIDLALAGHTNGNTLARSWVNGVETPRGGTHQRALEQVLKAKGLMPEVTLLHIIMERPEFAGPCKDKLWTPELEDQLVATINALLQA